MTAAPLLRLLAKTCGTHAFESFMWEKEVETEALTPLGKCTDNTSEGTAGCGAPSPNFVRDQHLLDFYDVPDLRNVFCVEHFRGSPSGEADTSLFSAWVTEGVRHEEEEKEEGCPAPVSRCSS